MNEFPPVVIFLHYLRSSFVLSSSLCSFSPFLIPLTYPPFVPFVIHLSLVCCLHTAPPIFIYNRVTFILLLSSLQSSSITSSIPPFSVAFSSRHIYHTSALIFLPPSVLPGCIFQSWFPLLIFPFSPLLLLNTYKTLNIHHVI